MYRIQKVNMLAITRNFIEIRSAATRGILLRHICIKSIVIDFDAISLINQMKMKIIKPYTRVYWRHSLPFSAPTLMRIVCYYHNSVFL